jgi:hypothetical protein
MRGIWLHRVSVVFGSEMDMRASRRQNHAKMKEYVSEALALVRLLPPRLKLIYSTALPLMRFPFIGKAMIATHHMARRIWY